MYKSINSSIALAMLISSLTGCSTINSQSLELASDAIGVIGIKSIEFSGTGRWYQFGQAPNPDLPWPPFDVKNFTTDINYDTASARVQITRLQVVEPGRNRPTPLEQKVDQYISGSTAWNIPVGGGAAPTPTAQPTAVEERAAEIWATPQGFLKAAAANHAVSEAVPEGTQVSFSVAGKYRYTGIINAQHQLVSVKTWIDNPILGDTLVDTQYSDYKDFGGVKFPGHILRKQGGFPILDINVTAVKANPAVDIAIPAEATKAPTVQVTSTPLADGVYYLTGGTHHSVAIAQRDHVVVVEGPQNEERSLAVIAKIKELIPNKPIKYLVNTHAHFDHAGGLRSYVDAGATIVTQLANQAYFQKVWANPHSINPDLLAKSNRAAKFEGFTGKHVLSDGNRDIEIYPLTGNSHNDAFVLVYLPKEKVLVEADAFTLPAPNAPVLPVPNPYSVNLYETIQKLKLDVTQIAGLHGARVATLADLRSYIGIQKASN